MRILKLPALVALIVSLSPFAAIAEDRTGSDPWVTAEVLQRKVGEELYRLGANAATVGIESAAMQLGRSFLQRAPEKSMEVMRHRLGHLLPEIKTADWLKRVDLDIDLNQNGGPVYNIRTRQPLFQSDQKVDTIFTQLRWGKDFQFGAWRDSTNLGIGYRRLLMDKTLLVGTNTFFDRDWRKDHNRFGWGLEVRWFGVDIYVNGYLGLSADTTINTSTTEKVLDGGDAYMLFQVPYVPSTRLVGRASRWDKSSGDKLHAWRAGVEADLTQYSQLQVGATDSDEDDPGVYVQLRVNFGYYGNRPVLLSKNPISDRAWAMRDMSEYTLDRVRRQENMVLERTTSTGGFSIVVGRT